MFITMLFTIAKIWKQPKCPSVGEWIKLAMGHLHNGILLSHEKDGDLTLCDNMDVPKEDYAN